MNIVNRMGGYSYTVENNINLHYLQAELFRIDILIRREVSHWQNSGQDPANPFRGLSITGEDIKSLCRLPFGTSWGHASILSEEEERQYSEQLKEAEKIVQEVADEASSNGILPRLTSLVRTFNLDPFERDSLLITLAPCLDLRYEKIFSYIQDDVTRKHPSVNLLLNILCEPGINRLNMLVKFASDAPLIKNRLLEPVPNSTQNNSSPLNQELQVNPTLVAWLLGHYQPSSELSGSAFLNYEDESQDEDGLTANSAEFQDLLANIPDILSDGQPKIAFYGPDRAGQDAAARLLASRLNLPLLCIDLNKALSNSSDPASVLHLAFRDARLTSAIPYFQGWDGLLTPGRTTTPEEKAESSGQSSGGPALFPEYFSMLCDHPGIAITSSKNRWQASGVERDAAILWISFPVPVYTQRLALWEYFLDKQAPCSRTGSNISKEDMLMLAGQFGLSSGQIRDSVSTARDRAIQERRSVQMQDLFDAARAHSNPSLGSMARKIRPRYKWQDIILPADQINILKEIVATVRSRPVVLDDWGLGQKLLPSSGVPILFSGPPGTGKTMAAEVISNELNLDLYKIDLSGVVSKYIGETEKNLERIFDEAENSSSILFFDEADSIFGKRSEVKDAHDRYANIEISYLLQRMERYDGVTILATNLRANLDEAFTRRLQFVVDFPFPEEEYRLQIWKTLFPPGVPRSEDLNFKLLAQRFKLAGGNIRNIIVNAAYLAASENSIVTMNHLLHGARRELQKMGRLVNEKDLVI